MTDEFTKSLAKLEELLKQTKEATREGRELLKDLKHERKEIEDFKKQMQQEIQAWLESSIDEHIVPELQKSFAKLSPQIDNLYKTVSSQVDILARPLEVAQPLIEQNKKDIAAVVARTGKMCETLDALEASMTWQVIKEIGRIDHITTGRTRTPEDLAVLVSELAKEGIEIHAFNSSGDHAEFIWDEVEGRMRQKKDASDTGKHPYI